MARDYKILNKQTFINKDCAIVPLRSEDRYKIMKWRNEQMFHLRQSKPLTKSDQDNYFDTVIKKLFLEDQPHQLLFSYLHNKTCIGYGGLVHINWVDKNAEISFIMDTELEKKYFSKHWKIFLSLIEEVAFDELKLHKIFTFAYDLRPHLYEPIEESGFQKEAILKRHIFFNGEYKNVVIHSKFNSSKKEQI